MTGAEPRECGEVRPGTLGYQRCWRPRGHTGDHRAQDRGQWCGACDRCAQQACHWEDEADDVFLGDSRDCPGHDDDMGSGLGRTVYCDGACVRGRR